MDLEKKLDSIERTEIIYVTAGILLLALTALGLQYQGVNPEKGAGEMRVSLTLKKPVGEVQQEVDLPTNSTPFDAVNRSFEVEYTEYDFGYFVTSIDGLSQNDTHSWLYYVNGEPANRAVNNYYLSDRDNVTFVYTSENPYE